MEGAHEGEGIGCRSIEDKTLMSRSNMSIPTIKFEEQRYIETGNLMLPITRVNVGNFLEESSSIVRIQGGGHLEPGYILT